MKTRILVVLALFTCALLPQARVNGQTIYGSVTGQVTDEQGASISGAAVKASNLGTGQVRDAVTNEEGLYRISGLLVGTYSVRAEKSGFAPATVQRVEVTVSTPATVDVKLGPGSVTAEVTVSGAQGVLLETTQSQVAKTVDAVKIQELPGRNSLNGLALLNPGVLPNNNGRPGSGFAVNGNRTRSNNFTIDGANNNDQSLSIPRQNLPPEALQEFQIMTNTFSAEYGRNAGSYINQITRSGTNEFHGSLFYAWNGNGYDALSTGQERTFNGLIASGVPKDKALRLARSVEVNHIYGGTVGGPIKKDHTFFFFDYDASNFRTTVSSATRVAISPTGVANLRANAAQFAPGALDFLLGTFPVANDPTSRGTVTVRNAAGAAVTTVPLQQFNRGLSQGLPFSTNFHRSLMKINTRINDNDQLSFRYLINNSENPGAPASIPGQEIGTFVFDQSFTINDVYTISSKLINEARATYSRRTISFPENLPTAFSVAGVVNAFTIGNANFPQFRRDNVYELTDNISYTTGNHNFKFGYNVLRYNLFSFFAPNLRGTISYPSIGEFLFDRNASFSQFAGTGAVPAVTWEHSWFGQDDWRVNPDLTLNLGVRYEYVTAPFGFFSNAKPDINNIGPRLGFAYNPKGRFDGRFVLRAAFAISYDQVFQNVLLNNSRNFPRGVQVVTAGVTGARPYFGLPPAPGPEEFVRRGGNPNLLPVRFFAPNERVKQPESRQWTLGIQYQLADDLVFKADYIGTQGKNLVREVEANLGFTAPLGNGLRQDPTKGSILVGQGIANSIYHSGQFTLEKRLSKLNLFGTDFGGLTYNLNYTYSSFISESDDILGGQANRTLPADPRNPGLDRARSAFDQPHRLVASYVYQAPDLFRGNPVLSRIFSGWSLSGVTVSASGTPFSVLSATNALGVLPGQIGTVERSQRVGLNPNGAPGTFTAANSLGVPADPNARFIVYPENAGILGSLGANTQRTGTTNVTDLGLSKRIRTFGETQSLQLRVEVFNVFNHRNFTVIPDNTLTSGSNPVTFLNLGQTSVAGRTFLFGAGYRF